MNRFTVVWDPEAIAELAEFWMESADRELVTKASHSADMILLVDPMLKGISLREGMLRLDCGPFHVMYSVNEADRLVEVHTIKRTVPAEQAFIPASASETARSNRA